MGADLDVWSFAVGYSRLSVLDIEHGALARQTEDIEEAAATQDLRLREVLCDEISASDYANKRRPKFETILGWMRQGLVKNVIIYDVDRLSRRVREGEDIADLCNPRLGGDCRVFDTNGDLNLHTGAGRHAFRNAISKGAKESDDISRRTQRKNDSLAKKGLPRFGGRRPFGFELDGVTVRDCEADEIRWAFDALYRRRTTPSEIARRWNEKGLRTNRGSVWTGDTAKRALMKPRYAGRRIHRGQDAGVAAWPALVDRVVFEAVMGQMSEKDTGFRPASYERHPLTGLVVSLVSGRKMRRATTNKNERRWREPKTAEIPAGALGVSVDADKLQDLVTDALFDRAAAPVEQARPEPDPADIEDVDELKATLLKFADWLTAKRITEDEYFDQRSKIIARIEKADRLREIVEEPRLPPNLREEWPGFDNATRRAIFHEVIDRVEIGPNPPGWPRWRFNPGRVRIVWRS